MLNVHAVDLYFDTALDIRILSKFGDHWVNLQSNIPQTAISSCNGHYNSVANSIVVFFLGEWVTFNGIANSNLSLFDWFEQLCLADLPTDMVCSRLEARTLPQPDAYIIDDFHPVFQLGLGHCFLTDTAPVSPKRLVLRASLP